MANFTRKYFVLDDSVFVQMVTSGSGSESESISIYISLLFPWQCEIVCAFTIGAKWPTDVGESMGMRWVGESYKNYFDAVFQHEPPTP